MPNFKFPLNWGFSLLENLSIEIFNFLYEFLLILFGSLNCLY